jgi:hypothetical protein
MAVATTEKRAEAKRLYVFQSMTCSAIATELGVSDGTVYRWRAEAAEKGEATDWEYQRQLHHISGDEVAAKYRKAIAIGVDRIDKDPALLFDSKTADAFTKSLKAMDKIARCDQYLSIILEFIEISNRWLAEHQPELRTKLAPYWDSIIEKLKDYVTQKD